MSRTGLDPVESALLTTLAEAGALPDRPQRRTALVLEEVRARFGFAPADTHRRIEDLAHPWVTALRLIDPHGNFGARDYEAAEPRYTELRLTPLGLRCVEADTGGGAPIPVGLIHGDLFKGGLALPLHPTRLVDALRGVRTGQPPAAVLERLGPPHLPTGSTIEGDLAALYEGDRVTVRFRAHLAVQGEWVQITNLPPKSSSSGLATVLHPRIRRGSELPEAPQHRRMRLLEELPISAANDVSAWGHEQLDVRMAPGAAPDEVVAALHEVWGVFWEEVVRYPAPMHDLLAIWWEQGADDVERGLQLLERELQGP